MKGIAEGVCRSYDLHTLVSDFAVHKLAHGRCLSAGLQVWIVGRHIYLLDKPTLSIDLVDCL